MAYARERSKLTGEHVRRAAALVAAGKVPGRGIDHADVGCPGLILRTTPLAVTWLYKSRVSTVRRRRRPLGRPRRAPAWR